MSGPLARAESWAPPRLDRTLLLKLPLAFAAALALGYLLRAPYAEAVRVASDGLLRAVEGADGPILRKDAGELELVTKLVRRGGGPRKTVAIAPAHFRGGLWSGMVFLCLVFLTPWRTLYRRWGRLAGAAVVVFAGHVGFTTLSMFIMLEAEYAGVGLARHGEMFMTIAAGSSHIANTILTPLLPFIAMTLVWFGRQGSGPKRPTKPARSGRNDPCPCGSGRKFKRCCGA